jgi:hypothetical protein
MKKNQLDKLYSLLKDFSTVILVTMKRIYSLPRSANGCGSGRRKH